MSVSTVPTVPNTVDKARAALGGCPPWDAFERPDKPVAEYDEVEALVEATNLTRVYLVRRGYEVEDSAWVDPLGGAQFVEAYDPDNGTRVILKVTGRVDVSGGVVAAPGPDERERTALKAAALAYAMGSDDPEPVRVDAVTVTIVAERMARLRHFVGVFIFLD